MKAQQNRYGTWEVTDGQRLWLAVKTATGDWKIEDGRDAQPVNPSGTRGRKILAAIAEART